MNDSQGIYNKPIAKKWSRREQKATKLLLPPIPVNIALCIVNTKVKELFQRYDICFTLNGF